MLGSVFNDGEIIRWAEAGNITPWVPDNVNPASLDLTLSKVWKDANNPAEAILLEQLTLYPTSLRVSLYNTMARFLKVRQKVTMVLACTQEWIRIPDSMWGLIQLKTTPCREGLGHPIAGWVDPGFQGQLTLMLHAYKPVTLHEGERVCQLILGRLRHTCQHPYKEKGHYYNQTGPTRSYRDQYA